ncbi:MAG: TM0106 family RecB-like putative nuclease [Acidobacteria bacterium]|nr:TM0106 family RecB-like putative nuclease [Acidobacteriota bacterium]MYJ03166.1 TM0106 family RecB-like putative nuclease [Acidobacteriota bacterium]
MRHADSQLLFSATDLSRHLACNHLTSLRRAVALGTIESPPPYDDPRADVLKQRGLEHEQRLLEQFTASGLTVEVITAADAPFLERDPAAAAARTEEAMRRGVDVIYQGRLRDGAGRWSGYPDFLLRVGRPSRLGGWSYEALDAKLARTAKSEALLQLLLYSDLLSQAQGTGPEWMHLALGGTDHEGTTKFRVVEYAAYYRAVRRRFEAHAAAPPETYPEPVSHCDICDWRQSCARQRRADDHLSLVAGIARGQRRRLVERNVTTMTDLAALRLPMNPRLEGVTAGALTRIREQARLQVQGQLERRHVHELITPVEADKGLASLPEPSGEDLFFDLEGDAFAADGGFEYLFGVADRNGRYDASWALDHESEKHAFERFIDRALANWAQHPGFHIYHYGAYETVAVKRLMSRYATREDEVDCLLRGRVFVDLHRAVRQGLRASVERYSIKNLEPFYGYARDVDLTAATRALVRFEAALESGNPGVMAETLRTEIEGYNRDDCLSTLRLAEWLETCRGELENLTGEAVPRPASRDAEGDREREETTEAAALFEALTRDLPVDDDDLDVDQRARRLLAYLLEFHRREDKSMWWEFFDRCGLKGEEFIENRATLGGLTYVSEVGQVKRSVVHRYRFPEQQHEIEAGDSPKNPATAESEEFKWGSCGKVVDIDDAAGTVDLKRVSNSPVPHPEALVPLEVVTSGVLQESLVRLAQEVIADGFQPDSPRRAAFDLLRRFPPRVAPTVSEPDPSCADPRGHLVAPGESPLEAVRRIARQLDRSVLPVQGPPGSGKTYTGAQAILDLLADGRRVGVTANSHKVISNLLGAVCRAAPVDVRGIQKAKDDDGCPDQRIVQVTSNDAVAAALASGEANLAGGTAWLWAREEMASAVDVLVIDEAGQMSLANTLAVSQAASSLVLLGDPRQLDQPIQGIHPPGADVSALGHLLGGSATVDPARGVFLDHTWRMHPDVCGFTTEQFYAGRLRSRPGLDRQIVLGTGPLAGRGLRFIPVAHAGNTNASDEEAERVAALVRDLLEADAAWIDQDGVRKPLRVADILIVAPYNAHVATLRARLPDGARAGTVDKFQGQEAPIVVYSMATSSADEAPRGMEFLYSLHRLNVATSRARCVAAIVASPSLFAPDCRTPQQMRLANPFCRFLELAEAIPFAQ